MGKFFLFIGCLTGFLQAAGQSLLPVGQWRNHLPMRQVVNVEFDGKKVIAASQYGLYFYDPTTREFLLKTTSEGLSDVRISLMSKDPQSGKIVVAYQNGNLDVLENEKLVNIPDILRSNFQGNKIIHNALWMGNDIFLSSSLGIIIVNTIKSEIKENIRIGDNGSNVEIFQLTLLGNQLFAATASGLKKTNYPNTLLSDYRQWTQENIPFASGEITAVLSWNEKLVVRKGDSLLVKENGIWKILDTGLYPLRFVTVRNGKLVVGQSRGSKGAVLVYENTTSPPSLLTSSSMKNPNDGIFIADKIWLADGEIGLISLSGSMEQIYVPASPNGIALGRGYFADGSVVATAGAIDQMGNPRSLPAGIFSYDGNSWSNQSATTMPALDSVKDITIAATDPLNGTLWAGSFGGGLVEKIKGGNTKIIKYGAYLSPAVSDPTSFRVTGLALDLQRNLWISNHGAAKPLVVRKTDGSWKNFSIPFSINGNTLTEIIVDEAGRKWILAGPGNGLICFDDAGTPDQINDDQWRLFRQGRGNGNLPSSTVLSVTADRNGFIWVGTDRGVALIQCGDDLFNPAKCEAILPVVQQNNVAGLLLANEQINDIKVDGADRKWFATSNGVWLLSPDAQKTVYRFTKSNGKLLSNQVYSLVIHQESGEVYFFTADGICSFRSTATEPQVEPKKLYVFPNPVPSGYTGSIAIKGLAANAWVRITELDGKLVFQTRSLGGQAIWNGKNYKGERANSGVYLIYTSDENNKQQLAGKIFFIR